MDPSAIIGELCRRHGVSPSFGNRLRPLIERAQVVAPGARERIMDLVERSFAEEARRVAREKAERAEQDRRMLSAVASILHAWEPPRWLREVGPPDEGAPPHDPEG